MEFGALIEGFEAICHFQTERQAIKKKLGIAKLQPDTPGVKECLDHQEHLCKFLLHVIFPVYFDNKYTCKVGKGSGAYLNVPYFTLLPPDQKTNDGVYVAVCFGTEGAGAVAGFAQSDSVDHELKTVTREPPMLRINVDGGSEGTKYNNSFQNPLEFLRPDFPHEFFAFLEHIEESLRLSARHLGLSLNTMERIKTEFSSALKNAGLIFRENPPESRMILPSGPPELGSSSGAASPGKPEEVEAAKSVSDGEETAVSEPGESGAEESVAVPGENRRQPEEKKKRIQMNHNRLVPIKEL